MEFLREHQLDLMLVLAGVCFAITLCGLFSNTTKTKKISLFVMGLSAAFLMIADRYAYIYRGDESDTGFLMVRICNFAVFLFILMITHSFNWYLTDMAKNDIPDGKVPLRLRINEIIIAVGILLVVVSQFTGLYYTFDEHNRYQRSDGYIISYVIPMSVWIIACTVIIQYRRQIDRTLYRALLLFILISVIVSVLQFFFYGISLTNIVIAALTVMLRLNEIVNTNRSLAAAHKREKELLIQKQESMSAMIRETTNAFAAVIDGKDKYTKGHSERVAIYSRMLAKNLGLTAEDQEKAYYMGLLHDIGKIAVPDEIINKTTKLTDDEFHLMQSHPIFGYEILKEIKSMPELAQGARWHHESYDGKGYPDKVPAKELPLIVRIVAVADSYDAMTSNRSYRKYLPQETARAEIEKNIGTQFDPEVARCMIGIIDGDRTYSLHE